MSRHLYRVNVEGSWVRRADGGEWSMHQWLRDRARAEGFSAEFDMSRTRRTIQGLECRQGTFEVSGIMVIASTASKAVTRAQAEVRRFVADLVCTSPKMTFHRDRARATYAYGRTMDRSVRTRYRSA